MSNDVTLTAALRSNLLSLQGTQRLLDSTQLRLSTGKKVNSALDNANAFFASQSLNFRASDLGGLMDGIGQGIQALKAADNAISQMTKLMSQAQAIAQEARDQASGGHVLVGEDIAAAHVDNLTAVWDHDGNPATPDEAFIAANSTFEVAVGEADAVTITIAAGNSMQDVVDQINEIDGVTASLVTNADGSARIRMTSEGEEIEITDGTGTPAAILFDGLTSDFTGEAPTDQARLQNDFNTILTQINDLVGDAFYRGTNLLDSKDLKVSFNEDGSSSLTVVGVDFSVGGADGGGLGINTANFGTVASINGALDEIKGALDTARATARSFGTSLMIMQTREDFTRSMINTLKEGSDKLTLADTNEEGAKLLSLQTSQQLGITALSMAAQAQQAVLRLF